MTPSFYLMLSCAVLCCAVLCCADSKDDLAAHGILLSAKLPAGCKHAASCLQRGKQAVAQEDPEVLARKAVSLDMQRNRFRRALGGEEEEDEAPPDMPVLVR